MNTKLTLNLDKDVIILAKYYAKKNNVSLSSLIENYLRKMVADLQNTTKSKGNIVDELSGIIQLDNDHNYKDEFAKYLTEKHQ